LEQKDVVVGGHREELTEQRQRLLVDGVVHLPAVAVLHDAHAAASELEELLARLLEDGERQSGRAGAEVVYARHDRWGWWRMQPRPGGARRDPAPDVRGRLAPTSVLARASFPGADHSSENVPRAQGVSARWPMSRRSCMPSKRMAAQAS